MKKTIFLLLCSLSTFSVFAQMVSEDVYGHKLPYTWDVPMYNGIMRSTLREDGYIVTQMITGCFNCGGLGACRVCGGTGGQYWYQIGIRPCGACGGSGYCRACNGKGYTITNTQTNPSGVTIGYDEHGNCYVAGPGAKIERGGNNNAKIYDCCSSCPTFGNKLYHTCKNCGEYHQVGNHKCIKK